MIHRILPNDVTRCADGIHCPERKSCDRWVLRANPRGQEVPVPWAPFFVHYGDRGCEFKIERKP